MLQHLQKQPEGMKIPLQLLLFWLLFCQTIHAQTADFIYTPSSGSFCTPQAITFTQTSSGTPTSFLWDFGNGERGNEAVETVIFSQPGTYTISLTAVYNTMANTISKTIVINETPTLNLTADRTLLCQPGSVNFTATGS
ncbi:MAG: PKD domain-containing protein, partial [Ferruginibacter sp.]